jgi:hypothetical protein
VVDLSRSPSAKVLLAVFGVAAFYAIGVIVRQHSGVCVIIRNESNEPVRELSVAVENHGVSRGLPDLARGDHERVFVKAVENSRILLSFTVAGQNSHTAAVFAHAVPGDCGTARVRLLPLRSTESVDIHRTVSWKGWLDFF